MRSWRLIRRRSARHKPLYMDSTPVALSPLEPGQRWVMILAALVPSIALAAGGYGLGRLAEDQLGWPWWPVTAAVALLAIWAATGAPIRRWRSWGWALAGDELHVAYGVWTQVHTVVPLTRVQHIDVAQGPLQRPFGVATLVVHTAGTAHATVVLPGISREKANELRDVIRGFVRAEPW